MEEKSRRNQIVLAIILATLGIVVPYLIAWRISPAGTVFGGFLLNPVDGFSYLAKMRQGYQGAWLFQLPYAAEPGSGTLLFIFYILLGHLSRLVNLPLIITYHLARIVFSVGFFITLYAFFAAVFEETRLKWAGFLFSLFGSGFGWIALPLFGRQSIDLWVPEAIPFLSAYTNPHFPLAGTAFVGGILLVYIQTRRRWWHWALAFVCGFTLAAVLPFATIPLFLVLGVWTLWEVLIRRGWEVPGWFFKEPWMVIVLGSGALPWLIYDYWLSVAHPILSQWNAQNLTPSLPLIDTLSGFGLMAIIALISLGRKPWQGSRSGRLFTVWLLLGFGLLYAPLPFQRRLSMGLYLPMTALSAWWLGEKITAPSRCRLAQTAIIIATLPSIILVIAVGVAGVMRGEQAVVLSDSEREAYRWIDANVAPGSLFLANPRSGNRLPAYTQARVLYGHPFETPRAEYWEAEVQSLLTWDGPAEPGLERLAELNVYWILLEIEGPAAPLPTWSEAFPVIAAFDEFRLLERDPR
ncbi:MAG: hypothetical protein P1P76_05155 [Anaerolineales bacterium]|nr:hypothetical protein [Anaerolineales bacterium]